MSHMLKITAASVSAPGQLRLTWDDGVTRQVDVSDLLNGHLLLTMLNVPEVFRDLRIVDGGGGIEWSNGADFCAQALRRRSDEQTRLAEKVPA